MSMSENFSNFTRYISFSTGKPSAFLIAAGIIMFWLLTGPFFGYSDTWQLAINTGTSLVTFLMVFMIQNTQYRDSAAVQIKLDELIRAHVGAHNILLDLEELTQGQIDAIRQKYENLAKEAHADLINGKIDTGTTNI